MIVTFKCDYCKKRISFNTSVENDHVMVCPKCSTPFKNYQYMNDFLEKIHSLDRTLDNVSLLSVTSNTTNKYASDHITQVFLDDIEAFEHVFYSTEPETKKTFSSIIDFVHLITYHDAIDNRIDSLNDFKEYVNKYFYEKIDKKDQKFMKFLFNDDEDK